MKGKSALFWLGLTAAAGVVLFETSYEVQELEEQLASMNRKIVAEQEAIQILKAEWSFLNDPTRLESLARQHLALRPTEGRQFVALDSVPMRPVTMPDALPAPAPLPNAPRVAPVMPPMAGVNNGGSVMPASLKAPAKPAAAPKAEPAKAVKPAAAPAVRSTDLEKAPERKIAKPTEVAARPAPQQGFLRPPAAGDSLGALVARLEDSGR
ncbi:hypothetical protein [Azospirillum sp. SYSU D00513]|uniref:cell division protein FtsL n=1 Tax=Azospirillum sp. SYSU D00513 TaxID=2812561 RepID=UPI001A966342|nr:hypothetical protein [Azospirillum sp. SYSU D00513]